MRTADDLRGNSPIPASVYAEHSLSNGKSADVRAMERLTQIKSEIEAAARAGDTAKLRALRGERKKIEEWQDRGATEMLVSAKAREIDPPAKGEEARLEEQARRLNSEVVNKQNTRQNLLVRLSRAPEHEGLMKQLDQLDGDLRSLGLQLEGVAVRQAEIARWHEEQGRRKRLAEAQASQRKAGVERKKDERRLEALAGEAVKTWGELLNVLEEFEKIAARRMRAEGLRNHHAFADRLREEIKKQTNLQIVFDDGGMYGRNRGWAIANRFASPEVAVPGAGSAGVGVSVGR